MTPEGSQYNTLTLSAPPEVLSLSLFLFLCPLKNGEHFSSALVLGVTHLSIGEIIYLEGLSETFA